MAEQRVLMMGVFSDDHKAAAAISGLGVTGFALERVHSPIPSQAIEAAMHRPKSKVGWFTLVGAVIGFFCGFALAAFCATRWSLIVGGKPVIALVPFVIVGFEFTILFAVFGNVAGLISQARLPRFGTAALYDTRFTGDKFGVIASCPTSEHQRLADFFQEHGAEINPRTEPEPLARAEAFP